MASSVDLKVVIHHIVNGTLADNLCLICLKQVDELSEHILTTIYKDGKEYCIADVLKQVCQIEFSDITQFRVCSDCFITASAAYKFFLSAKRTQEILNFYTEELQQKIDSIDTNLQSSEDSSDICISLPLFTPNTEAYDYDLDGLTYHRHKVVDALDIVKMPFKNIKNTKFKFLKMPNITIKKVKVENQPVDASQIGMVIGSDKRPSFLKPDNGKLVELNKQEVKRCIKKYPGKHGDVVETRIKIVKMSPEDLVTKMKPIKVVKMKPGVDRMKQSKVNKMKQPPVKKLPSHLYCSHCTMKYRRVAMLTEHMKTEHNIDFFMCKICRATAKNAKELEKHIIKTHANSNRHICATCYLVFKRKESIISHLKKHEELKQLAMTGSHVCKVCKKVLANEEKLEQHFEKQHAKKFTCHYCGKLYRRQSSLDGHLKKHEMQPQTSTEQEKPAKNENRSHCPECGRTFVNDKALMMHMRLHTNERPHICDICGRGFVSQNRRNQHIKVKHTAPSHRCPLCPALYHMRSLVNHHIKMAHLEDNKRGYRASKYKDVSWQTEAVPIQELSVSIQNQVLELKAAQEASEGTEFGAPEWLL